MTRNNDRKWERDFVQSRVAVIALFLVVLIFSSVEAFVPLSARTMMHNTKLSSPTPTTISFHLSVLNLSSKHEEEVAALRAAAQKARDEANRLSEALGRVVDENTTNKKTSTMNTTKKSTNEIQSLIASSLRFDTDGYDDAATQSTKLDSLVSSGDFSLWKSAVASSANTPNSPTSLLRPFPVSLNFLEMRSGGKLTAESLGVLGGDMDVNLNDFKDSTIVVTLGASALAIASLALLPENVGATLCYLFALVPIVWIAIGSTAPAILAGVITTVRQRTSEQKEEKELRIVRHEAGHFLCGYLCGLPIKQYSTNDDGCPCVEFHVSSEGDARGRELTQEEIASLSVVAMSGSVAEVLSYGKARGGNADLMELDAIFRRSKEFIGAAKQQDLTRWGALAAYNLIVANMEKYEKLVAAFQEKKGVVECITAIESQ